MTTMMMTRMLFGYYYYSLLCICTTTSFILFASNDVVVIVAAANAANAADADAATILNREEEILNQNLNKRRTAQEQQDQNNQKHKQEESKRGKRKQSKRNKPNFVIILTDDLDYSLGGINASTLNKTRYYIGGGDGGSQGQSQSQGQGNSKSNNKGGYGKTIHNWFVQTPVCCASRAELLTGKMYHNLKVGEQVPPHVPVPPANNNTNTNTTQKEQPHQQQPHQCMHINVDGTNSSHIFWDHYYFAQYFSNSTASASTSESASSKSESNEESFEFESESESESEYNNNLLDYTIGLFGKHLNSQNPSNFLPKGINEMLINGGGNYINPSFTHGIRRTGSNSNDSNNDNNDNTNVQLEEVLFNNCTKTTGYPCYSTSVIGNASLAWIRKQVQVNGNVENGNNNENVDDTNEEINETRKTKRKSKQQQSKPFFAFISLKAPHIQDGNGFPTAIPAPWYKDTIINEMMAPRTPNYNTTGSTSQNPKHWLIRQQTPITQLEEVKIDQLYTSRLKSLLSVDDLIEELITTLGPTDLNVLHNTYIIFTSDNGYRLGQYQIPQCKLHPYENDLRVPFLIRGPGIYNKNVNNANEDTDAADADNNNSDRRQREQQQPTASSSSSTEIESSTTTTATADANTNAAVTTSTTLDSPLGAIFSHIHLMPTLLGLATFNYNSQSFLPKTMDGTNLASYILDYNPTTINDDIDQNDDDDNSNDNEKTTIDTSAAAAAAAATTFTDDSVIDPTTSTNMRNTTMTMTTTTTTTTMNDTTTSSTNVDNNVDVVSLLIEYTSLGNVRRYQHLVDTYNHSFIALRIMPKYMALQTTQSQTQVRYKKRPNKHQQKTLLHDIKQQQSQTQQSLHYYLKKYQKKNLNRTTTLTTATATANSRQRQRSRVLYNNTNTTTNTSTTTTTTTTTKTRDTIKPNKKNNNVNVGIISNNIKYIEFRDSRLDYTNTKTKPCEYELYDLDIDPYELNNIYYNNNNNNIDHDHADISLEYKKKLENKIKRLLHCNGQSCRYEHSTGL